MKVIDLGLSNYRDCYNLQKRLLNEIKNNGAEDHIIVTEHLPVITIGRIGSRKNLLVSEEFLQSKHIEVVEVDRGGDITYHGPGQIILYSIINLKNYFKDIHKYLHRLEDIVISLLQENNIKGFKVEKKTGVWTNGGKIASIGIGVSGWVTFHGLALNVDCDLTPFRWINPCGFKDIKITSMKKLTNAKIDNELIKERLIDGFRNTFRGA
ncbi:MAG: lipoyl(octanoyl) transferase LipB, partial [Candidatus Omnitrophica bacterium]|nr:lipoyl(octanoyl) transferase LipB [Candidatus Omnitrophota bacterium]